MSKKTAISVLTAIPDLDIFVVRIINIDAVKKQTTNAARIAPLAANICHLKNALRYTNIDCRRMRCKVSDIAEYMMRPTGRLL